MKHLKFTSLRFKNIQSTTPQFPYKTSLNLKQT